MKYLFLAVVLIALSYGGVIEEHSPGKTDKERHQSIRLEEDADSIAQYKTISKRSVGDFVYGTFSRVVANVKNYPYNQYSFPQRQDDVSLSIFERVIRFLKRGVRRMLNGYDQVRRQGFAGLSNQALAAGIGVAAIGAAQRENVGTVISNVMSFLEPETQEMVAEVVPIPVNGGVSEWGDWEAWTTCTATCFPGGTQTETRSRTCTNPKPMNGGTDCSDPLTETNSQTCSTGYCFPCTVSCGECTSGSPCAAGAGDCDSDDECAGALTCQFNNPNVKCTGCNSNTCPSGRDCCG